MYPMSKTPQAAPSACKQAPRRNLPRRPRRIQVRKSGVHGKGVFALKPIAAGERIIEYTGEIISWPEALRRHPHDPADPNHTFYFSLDDGGHVIDAKVGGNASRWINHACEPNCEADEEEGRVFIKALRDLPGEELFYDYGLVIDERYTPKLKKEYECRCGSPSAAGPCFRPSADHVPMRFQQAPELGRRSAVAGLEPLLPGISVEVHSRIESTNTQAAGPRACPERPARRARHAARVNWTALSAPRAHPAWPARGRHLALPAGGRAADARPRPPGAGLGQQCRRIADVFTFAAAGAGAVVGPVAGRGPGPGRCAGPHAAGAAGAGPTAHRPEVAQRPVADGRPPRARAASSAAS
jgi:hypothetical protein